MFIFIFILIVLNIVAQVEVRQFLKQSVRWTKHYETTFKFLNSNPTIASERWYSILEKENKMTYQTMKKFLDYQSHVDTFGFFSIIAVAIILFIKL